MQVNDKHQFIHVIFVILLTLSINSEEKYFIMWANAIDNVI